MASPYLQQVRRRKLVYIGLILVLFSLSWAWRQSVIAGLADHPSINAHKRGEVELVGSVVRLGLTGSRGLATCILWSNAIDKQKKNQWNELEVLVRSLTKLQPHFITPWLFQSWNLAYNVSVESDRVRDKYFYVSRGIELLAQGERQNRNHPDMRWSIGFYGQHKVGMSDETNYMRSLFQLSLIPPNKRDPARFWTSIDNRAEFNWAEFEKFCRQHPQLVRRLRDGIARDTAREKRKQFTCESPADVVQFLEDNYNVPSLYEVEPLPAGVPAHARMWAEKQDRRLPPAARFPVLPQPRKGMFDDSALNDDATLGDGTDIHAIAHSWYAYAQECLPPPDDELPGQSKPIERPGEQRRPKHMTTLIFRNYPAQACRYMAERLQQEGWFLEESYDLGDWFQEAKGSLANKDVRVGGRAEDSSLLAWRRASLAWEKHGKENHLLFDGPSQEQNTRQLAERFAKRYKHVMKSGGMPPTLREEELTAEEREEYRAARIIFEYDFYRQLSNFPHHYNRGLVERKPETVTCRKFFYQALQAELAGSPGEALRLYRTPIETPAWPGKKLSPLEAWRTLVLEGNPTYREDNHNQEQAAEIGLRYLELYDRFDGLELRKKIVQAARVLPLVPVMTSEEFRLPVVPGPFDVDSAGKQLIKPEYVELARSRTSLTPRKAPAPGAKEAPATGPSK